MTKVATKQSKVASSWPPCFSCASHSGVKRCDVLAGQGGQFGHYPGTGSPALPVFMKRDAQHQPRSLCNLIHAVFTRLKAIRAADTNQTVASAEQHGVAQARRDHPPARLLALRHIAEEELTTAKSLLPGHFHDRAENHRHLDREVHRPA